MTGSGSDESVGPETPPLAGPSPLPEPTSSVLSEDELTEIRLRDIAFGDAEELSWQ